MSAQSSPRMARGILIDPWKREITEVRFDADDHRAITALLQPPHGQWTVRSASPVRATRTATLLVDDDGLLPRADAHGLLGVRVNQAYFVVTVYPSALAGMGLIVDYDSEGETVDCSLPLAVVQHSIQFIEPEQAFSARYRPPLPTFETPGQPPVLLARYTQDYTSDSHFGREDAHDE